MVRRLKSSWLVLAGWLVSGCFFFGGQTGEPTSDRANCSDAAAPWGQPVDGVSPEQLALAYQGEHRVKLHWSKAPASAEPVTLTLAPREQSGTVDICAVALSVPVNFSLRAEDGTIIDSGQGSLSAGLGKLQHARLSGSGQHFLIVGSLSQATGQAVINGTLEPRVGAATGDSADFSSDSGGFAGAWGI